MPRTFLFICALWCAAGWQHAIAQAPTPGAVPPAKRGDEIDLRALPTPAPAAPSTDYPDISTLPVPSADSPNEGYPDIEKLRKPGSSEKLFPAQPAATPGTDVTGTTGLPATGANARRFPGQRNPGVLGKKRNSGRQRDLLVDAADSDPLEVRVAFRRAKTEAMVRDPGLADLLRQADAANTDTTKRVFLKQYYTRLYALVVKVDHSPEMKKHVELLSQVSSSRYDPRRREVGGDEDIINGRGGGRLGGGRSR